METLIDSIIDFVRVRQLNIVVGLILCFFLPSDLPMIILAGVLTLIYLAYQYWGLLFKGQEEDVEESRDQVSRSRSRSCSRSRQRSSHYDYKSADNKNGRRGRKAYRRCPDCN